MTPAELTRHIETLCAEHSIKLEYRPTPGGRASRRSRWISIARVKSAVSYAVALHEIGHILGRSPSRRLDREAAAWEWAKENAIQWDDRMQAKMKDCLDSYARWFCRKWRRGVYIGSSASFDLLLGHALTTAMPRPVRKIP